MNTESKKKMKKEIKYIKPFLSDISEDLKLKILSQLGHNTISFQFLEGLLKTAIPIIDFKIYHKDLENKNAWLDSEQIFLEVKKCREKFISKINKETLGSLVNLFLEFYSQERSDSIHEEAYFEQPGLIFSNTISIDWTLIKGSKKDSDKKIGIWKNLVQERNKVVHHLAFEYDLNCSKSCEELLSYLKKQKSEIQGCIKDIEEIMKMAVGILEPQKKLENLKIKKAEKFHELFATINVISINFKEKDGWTQLSVAGNLVRKRALKELKEYKSINGCRNLEEILVKSNLYEIRKEGHKIWFRLKTKIQ